MHTDNLINWIKEHQSSLVKFTGLLVCMGIMGLIISCGGDKPLYDSSYEEEEKTEETDTDVTDEIRIIPTPTTEPEEPETILVHICGAVMRPGVYELASDSRVIDGINLAGGFNEEASTDALNLASRLTDGSRVYVPTVDEVVTDTTEIEAPAYEEDERININTADITTLTGLKGVGETRAKSIIAYREENGGFKSIEDIMNVSGIGPASFEKIKDDIRVN